MTSAISSAALWRGRARRGNEAVRLFRRQCEGIVFDPVYTGKCAAAMIRHIGEGAFGKGEVVVFRAHRRHPGGIHPCRASGSERPISPRETPPSPARRCAAAGRPSAITRAGLHDIAWSAGADAPPTFCSASSTAVAVAAIERMALQEIGHQQRRQAQGRLVQKQERGRSIKARAIASILLLGRRDQLPARHGGAAPPSAGNMRKAASSAGAAGRPDRHLEILDHRSCRERYGAPPGS